MYRSGFGNDIHRLEAGKMLVLGGVRIESDLGAVGHSDADALVSLAFSTVFVISSIETSGRAPS